MMQLVIMAKHRIILLTFKMSSNTIEDSPKMHHKETLLKDTHVALIVLFGYTR